jgi:hypothetical protein
MSRSKQGWTSRLLGIVLGVVLLPILLPLLLLIVCLVFFSMLAVHLLVCLVWLPRGKDVLFVYSDSPTWHEYMMHEVLPLVADRAVILNWSHRHSWSRWSLATWAFRMLSGHKNYNPLVVLFRPLRRSRTFRFWAAFQEKKHGNGTSVEQLTGELKIALDREAVQA